MTKSKRVELSRIICDDLADNGYNNGQSFVQFTDNIYDVQMHEVKNWLDTKPFMTYDTKPGSVTVEDIDTIGAALKLAKDGAKVAILNFASAWQPGGGWLKGASAQEECLCYRSTLFASIAAATPHYADHHVNEYPYNPHRFLYTPNMFIYRDENGDVMSEPVKIGCFSCAAVDYRQLSKHPNLDRARGNEIMGERINAILTAMNLIGYTHIVLGAWGCGVFKNFPKEIAGKFNEYLFTNKNTFKRIIFAIPNKDSENYQVFKRMIKDW